MRKSTTVPHAATALGVERARRAEAAGLDGIFVYDHLWQLGRPGTPAYECLTQLAAMAAATERIRVGALVLRAGLRPPEVSLAALRTVASVAPGRLVAGLGTGDHLNAEENRRFGVPYARAAERLDEVRHLAAALAAEGVEVWIGGLGRRVRELCAELGLTWNCWGISDADLRARLAEVPQARVTWGGLRQPPPFTVAVDEVVVAGS